MKDTSFLTNSPSPWAIKYIKLLESQSAETLGVDLTIKDIDLRQVAV